MTVLEYVSDLFADLFGGLFSDSLQERIRIESVEDEQTFSLKDGSLVSIIRIDGSNLQLGNQELAEAAVRMRVVLAPFLSGPGHAVKFTFARDPASAERIAQRAASHSRQQAARLGLKIEDVLSDRECRLAECLVSESNLISVHTRHCGDSDARRHGPSVPKSSQRAGSRLPGCGTDEMYARHVTFVEAMQREFRNFGQLANVLDAVSALREIRASLYPFTNPWKAEWTPRLFNSKADMPTPASPSGMFSIHSAAPTAPPICWQLATEDAEIVAPGIVRIGNALFSGLDVTIAPEILTPFNALVASLTSATSRISWRCAMLIESGGLQSGRIKEQYTRLFAFAAPTRNGRIRDAFDLLREADGADDTIVRLQISFAAWAELEDEKELRRNSAILRRAVESWGNAGADGVTGSPIATVVSSVPGITLETTAPPAAAPLSSALAMAPLARQAGPWSSGPILFRTGDGKIWPYRPGSSKQNNWVEIFIGTPGSGKSVAMNAFNLAALLHGVTDGSDGTDLPRVAVIDIGHSSKGLIELIREALPARRRHEAGHFKLKMTPKHAVNVFDTCLGMRKPFASERSFLVNFLIVLCCDGKPGMTGALTGLIGAVVDLAYEDVCDDRNPKRYIAGEVPAVDSAFKEIDFQCRTCPSWWEAADALFAAGRVAEAAMAQSRAVPVLSDLVSASHSEQVISLYGDATDGSNRQPVLASFHRRISEASRDFVILSGPTLFNLGVASVVALDLDEVTSGDGGDGARRQAAAMFMLARHIVMRDWMLDVEEIRAAVISGHMPEIYESYHVRRSESLRRSPKLFCMDEFHRAGRIPGIQQQVLQDIREGRKHNVRIALASQLPEDFENSVLEMASSIFVFSPPSSNSIRCLREMFGLTDHEQSILKTRLAGPSKGGTPVWCIFRHKEGECRQLLYLTLGPAEIWSLSTTPEDVALREMLYDKLGPRLARQTLAARFPHGSAKSEIEARLCRETGGAVSNGSDGGILEAITSEFIAASKFLCPACRGGGSVEAAASSLHFASGQVPSQPRPGMDVRH